MVARDELVAAMAGRYAQGAALNGVGSGRVYGGDRLSPQACDASVAITARPHVRLKTGQLVSQYAGNEGCAGLAGAEPHA